MIDNLILETDSYKVGHWRQYPPGTTSVYSYLESRGGKFDETIFFGLQYILKRHLQERITMPDVFEAEALYQQHFGTSDLFNKDGWQYIVRKHGGRLPVKIKAVPEGTRVKTHNVLVTIENTDPACFWLTNFLETLLMQVWYPTTVATLSGATRKLILSYLEATGDPGLIDFKLHDFGFRGATSLESAAIAGGAHLVNFLGTDTVPALTFLSRYYSGGVAEGFSVPASEHSTMTSWGREHEVDAYRNMVEQYGSNPFYSVVSDSYDLYGAAKDLWGNELRNEVLEAAGTLVVRPDSGHPAVVVPNLLRILGEQFGVEKNSKGWKVLNPKVRVIQGDGMDYGLIQQTLQTMDAQGWSADNVTFGMGGGLTQKVDRDTQKFAFKCSSVTVGGVVRDVFKDPATDQAKASKRGRLALVPFHDNFGTAPEGTEGDVLKEVYSDGWVRGHQALTDIRERAKL